MIRPTLTVQSDSFVADELPPAEHWPRLIFDLPELQYPERLNVAVELLDQAIAEGHGARVALITLESGAIRQTTYARLGEVTNRMARVLTEDFALVPGNRVLLRSFNNPMAVAWWLAIVKAGLVAVATMPLLRAKELNHVIDRARIDAAICDVRLERDLELARRHSTYSQKVFYWSGNFDSLDSAIAAKKPEFSAAQTSASDSCLIAFTSGTTGTPKATIHFHRDVLAICDTFSRYVLRPVASDVFCGTPPIAFTFGLGGLLVFPLAVRASTVLIEKPTPETMLNMMAACGVSICFTAPTFYRQMAAVVAQQPGHFDLSRLKISVSAGEALPDATRQAWKQATGLEMLDGIGATEMTHIFIGSAAEEVRRGAIGRVVPGFRAQVVDNQGRPLPIGQVGRLAVIGPTGCRYLSDERQTIYVQDGWNIVGDLFRVDVDGYFYYHGRDDDMIISAGYNIASIEVESTLLEHPAVRECAVIGEPDAERGEIVKAFVVLSQDFTGNSELVKVLQDYVKQSIAPYKYPRAIEFCDALPRTETGKLQRFKLRVTPSDAPRVQSADKDA
jgi:2-aminobenzoate-CoA ligase